MRELLLAAFFHDFNHIGRTGNDDVNIQVALWSFKQYMTQADAASFSAIEALIKRTGYPYKTDKIVPSLSGRILRDADVSQALSVAWVQQVVLGLSSEMSIDPIKVFEMQEGFLKNITFETDWANQLFAKEVIWAKIQETKSYLEIYNGNDESPWDETYALVEHAWLPYGKKHKFF